MILYHFTSIEALDDIRSQGLTKGDVPITPSTAQNAVWLTSDPEPDEHGLTNGSRLNPKAEAQLWQQFPHTAGKAIFTRDKQCVRITVRIPSTDRALKHWPSYGRKRLEPEWYDSLTVSGGGKRKAKSWFLCFRPILPTEFLSIDILRESQSAKGAPVDEEAIEFSPSLLR